MLNLGVNIDHVATVRQARMAAKPEPLEAAMLAEKAGAWGITAHLREDRRHMQDADLALLAKQVRRLNMEMAVTDEMEKVGRAVETLKAAGIVVSLFIDPDLAQLDAAAKAGADYVELHTGTYSNTAGAARAAELERLKKAAEYAHKLGIRVNAGHGIDYENIDGILEVPHLCELNIGHSIVGRAIMVGMEQAVREMIELMKPYRF